MKSLKDYAREHGVTYRTAWNRAKAGRIKGAVRDEFGRIWVPDDTWPTYTEITGGDTGGKPK